MPAGSIHRHHHAARPRSPACRHEFRFRDSALNGENPLDAAKTDCRDRNYGFNVGGASMPEKASFSVNIMRGHDSDVHAATSRGDAERRGVANIVKFKQRDESVYTFGSFD